MGQNFLPCDRDQELLLPPSLSEWLAEDHLAWFVLDAVAALDLEVFYASYRRDGWGAAAHDPQMVVALLVYAYAIGERSSRAIERRCREDVAFRVITANQVPDHATIARFRVRHEAALGELSARLRQLFELPSEFGGVLTTGATMANFVALAAARNWWGEQHGVDVEADGVGKLPSPVILSSGYLHPSAVQAIGMLGLGRANIRRLAGDDVGRLDLAALERELAEAGAPTIVIANAGEVNAGDFDPIVDMAELCERHTAWLHVDGAFGLFARLAPDTRALTAGVERADSVISDGHKWLNVPYDCGFAFVREMERLPRALNVGAPYLPAPDDPHPNFGFLSPENSRRARALAVWATLRAYGRTGYRAMVERHVALARHLADRVDSAPELERLADVPLNIVCFRAHPPGLSGEQLDELNNRLAAALRADGRVFVGSTTYAGKAALRPAIVNWLTHTEDVDLLVDVTRELTAAELASVPEQRPSTS